MTEVSGTLSGVAPITPLRMCVIKIEAFKGEQTIW